MGRFSKTGQSKFLDFVYQPDLKLQMGLMESQVKNDALKKSFASLAEYEAGPTFEGWSEDMNSEIDTLNQDIDPIVQRLMKNPNDRKAVKELKGVTSKAKGMFTTGKIGQMQSHYAAYGKEKERLQEQIKKARTSSERAALTERLDKYDNYFKGQVGNSFREGFNPSNLSSHLDSQEFLKSRVDVGNLKMITKDFKSNTNVANVNGRAVPLNKMARVQGNQAFDKDGNVYPIVGSKQLILEQYPGLKFQNYYDEVGTEGFQQGLINQVASIELMKDEGYQAMIRQDYNDFGMGAEGQTLEEYVQQRTEGDAAQFALKHPELTKETHTLKNVDDKFGLAKYKENRADARARMKARIENPLPEKMSTDASFLADKANILIAKRQDILKKLQKTEGYKQTKNLTLTDVIAGVGKAITRLEAIPVADRTEEDKKRLKKHVAYFEKLEDAEYATNKAVRASWDPIKYWTKEDGKTPRYSSDEIDDFVKGMNSNFHLKAHNDEFMLDLGNGQQTPSTNLQSMVGTKVNGKTIKEVRIIPKSATPVFISESYREGKIQSQVELVFAEPLAGNNFMGTPITSTALYTGYSSMEDYSPSNNINEEINLKPGTEGFTK